MLISVRPILALIRVFSLPFVSMETCQEIRREREWGRKREREMWEVDEQRMRGPIWPVNIGVESSGDCEVACENWLYLFTACVS